MSLRIFFLVALSSLSIEGLSARAGDTPQSESQATFWVIPHTHWEGAVFKTREEYLAIGLPNIQKAMKLLREQPGYRFVLDQVAYVKPFLERYPDQEADFRKFLKEGRLQLVGGLDVMPDVNMPGGETFVRQMQYGKGYYRRKLGVEVTTGWLVDTFGHHAQMPQLLALGGYKSFWFSRGVPRADHPSEFFWEGIDGTRIPAFYLPHSYGLLYHSPQDLPAFYSFARQRFDMLNPNARGQHRVGLSGADVSEPEEHLVSMVEAFNKKGGAPFVMRMALPSDFETAVAGRNDLPVFRGEFNPIFQGTYSSRIELKAWMRLLEQKLITAEKLAALASWLGATSDQTALWRAWELVLFNETHDLASGVMTNHVYNDTVRNYENANRSADELIDAGWNILTSKIDTRGPGTPIVVFNSLGWSRSDIVEVVLDDFNDGETGASLVDEAGEVVSAQYIHHSSDAAGKPATARVVFLARDVPAMGYRTYHYIRRGPTTISDSDLATGSSIENSLYKVNFDIASGAIKSLKVKNGDWEVFSDAANVVARQPDKGDLWELYHGLDGGSKIAMTARQPVPAIGQAVFSNQQSGKPGTLRTGPVFSEFTVSHPFDTGNYATTVRVYEGLRRIDCQVRLVNNEKYVRYQGLFPTTIKHGKGVHEIPFGAIERPSGIEFPAQNWVDYGDGKKALAVLNIGLPGNVISGDTMMVSLLRAQNLGAYGFGGGYEPGMSSETGFELGVERSMRYALVPHDGDWKDAGVHRDALEFNHPLLARVAEPHVGILPSRRGFVDVSAPAVVLSDIKPGRAGGVAVRLYEATGRPAVGVTITMHSQVLSATTANLLEDPGESLALHDSAVRLDFRPFEIKTILFRPSAGTPEPRPPRSTSAGRAS